MIRLSLPSGLEADILPRGATLAALRVPDRVGGADDILLGTDPAGPATGRGFFGVTVGRYANRIAGACFALDGQGFELAANDGPHCLHGGPEGFDLQDWCVVAQEARSVTLALTSPDGDQGFPGTLKATVTYALVPNAGAGRVEILFQAETDRSTPVSLTNHAFFNLRGGVDDPARLRGIDDHILTVAASAFLPVDGDGIPFGVPQPVEGTPFDFRQGRPIGRGLRSGHPQLLARRGYDHCLCLDGHGFRHAAVLEDPQSGRRMALWTDQPGLQLYSGNFLDGRTAGKGGAAYRMGDALCLEPGAWPDSPNRPDFPDSILRPGQQWRHRMALEF